MSVLSRNSIKKRLNEKNLVVSPLLMDKQIGVSSVDLRMGTVVMVARAGAMSHVNPTNYKFDTVTTNDHKGIENNRQKHERFDVPFGDSFLLHSGTLALVPTLEWVTLPYDLQGVVTARSTWAREGLNIATATIINPKYKGIITLELANLGEIPIKLYPGLRLAQIAFYELLCDKHEEDKKIQREDDTSQFDMSFEPSAGNLVKEDEQSFV